jgi:hypothetical protein
MAKASLDSIAITDHEAQDVERAHASALNFVSRFEPANGAS